MKGVILVENSFVHPYMPNSAPENKKAMLDELGINSVEDIYKEAYTTPQVVKEAPHHAALGSRIQEDGLIEWKKFATTWRAYIKMKKDS